MGWVLVTVVRMYLLCESTGKLVVDDVSFDLGWLWATLSLLNGEMPLLSHFFSLMKDHSFFGLLSSPETRSST